MYGKCDRCLSRRDFLKGAGGTIACLGLLTPGLPVLAGDPDSRTPVFPKGRAHVKLIFSHVPTGNPTWPTKDYDYDARAKELTDLLRRGCPGVTFDVKSVHNVQEAQQVVDNSKEADGYIVYLIGIWTWAADACLKSGKPTVIVDDLYAGSGEALAYGGKVKREKLPALVISSSDMNDVVRAANLFKTVRALKETNILDVVNYDISALQGKVKENLGITLSKMDSAELASYYDKASEKEALAWADFWMKGAKRVVEPPKEEIVKSGRMYLALCQAMADKKADAVSLDCLGMFYGGVVTAYPCLSHFQMNNDGSTAVCEGDINSTVTQLVFRYAFGKPGYVSDPVIDTSKDEIIYAHCVAHNRPFGPKGRANPYVIRSHAEDEKGASVQSLLPSDEPVTTAIMDVWGKAMVIHSGVTTRNVDEKKACRTKIAARTDAQAILDNWSMGWHRVTVFGNHRRETINLARLLGFSVFEEDKA